MKYIIQAKDEHRVIDEKEYNTINSSQPNEMVKIGDNFYYRKDIKIYKSGSRPFIRLMGETQSLSALSKDTENIHKSYNLWLSRWKKKSPEQKTLIELHNRYGIELSKKLHLSHEFIGYWDNETEEMTGEFIDVISRFWGLAGLDTDSLNSLYDKMIDYFTLNPNQVRYHNHIFESFKKKLLIQTK
jgi:hypothetical protein